LEPRRRAVRQVRPAVHLEHERPPPAPPPPGDEPRLDLVAVGVRHGEALRVALPAAEPPAPVARQPAQAAFLHGADLAGAATLGRDGGDPPAANGEVGADDVAVDKLLDRPVEAEAEEVTASAVADRRDEPLVVEPEHAGLARGRAVEIAARQERDRAVELGAEPPQPGALDDVEVVVRPAG